MTYHVLCANGDCQFHCWAKSPDLVEVLVAAHVERTSHTVYVELQDRTASNEQGGKGATERRPS